MAKSKKAQQTFVLFLVTFIVSLIVITYFIKSFSPNVDVEIGGSDDVQTVEEESESDVKQAIDDRLRWIQMEDNMPGASKREGEEEITYIDDRHESSDVAQHEEKSEKPEKAASENSDLQPVELVKTQVQAPAQPPVPQVAKAAPEPPKMTKIYVGSYSTIEQAIQAQNKLMSTTMSVSPFVKEVNGHYVLQAGSYANPQKADAVAAEITRAGFPVRMVKE